MSALQKDKKYNTIDILHFGFNIISGMITLQRYFGYFIICEDCIGVDWGNKVKIWHNSDFVALYPQNPSNEQAMVKSYLDLLQKYDASQALHNFLLSSAYLSLESIQ